MLPSSRVSVSSFWDRDILIAVIAALYDQLDIHDAVVADHHSLEELCRDLKLQID